MADNRLPPPYMSFGIFKSTAERLADTVVPTGPLDRRVLDDLSGADYGSLISGLRFLGLTDEQRRATDSYRKLVATVKDPGRFKAALADIINTKYAPITGNVDVANGTISELEKAFKDADVSAGQMLTKTVRFYVKALQETGVMVSPHITKARKTTPRPSGTTRKKQTKLNGGADAGATPPPSKETAIETGYERMPIPGLGSAFIQYPTNLTEANCDLFEAMIGVLRTYVKGRASAPKKP